VIPAVLAPAAALLARLAPVLARLEPRHWVALVGSAGLHLGVFLGLSQAPPPLPPPLTFEVKLEPPPAVKQPKQRRAEAKPKASKVKAKKRLAKKKTVKPQAHEPHTLQAEWKSETRPAKDTPAVTLPDARALGVDLAQAIGRAAPAKLAATSAQPGATSPAAAARASAAGTLSEPGGKSGAGNGAASGGEPGIALAAAQGLGKTQALSANSGAGAQGSDALAGSAAASGNLAAASLAASAAAGSSLNRAASGGGHSVQASDFSTVGRKSEAPSAEDVRLTMAGILSSLPALPAGSGSLAGSQSIGAAGASAATTGQGSQASLATAAGSGQPAVVAAAGPTRAGAGSATSTASERGAAARGGSGSGNLTRAAPGSALPASKTSSGQGGDSDGGSPATSAMAAAATAPNAGKTETALARVGAGDSAGKAPTQHQARPGSGEAAARTAVAVTGTTTGGDKLSRAVVDAKPAAAGHGATLDRGGADGTPGNVGLATAGEPPSTGSATHGLAGAGLAAVGKLAGSSSPGAAAPSQAGLGSGFSGGPAAPAALALGEPGSAPRLALAMHAVPAILEIRPGGARASFRAQSGAGGGGPAHNVGTALVQAGGGAGAPLQARGDAAPALSNASRQASVGSGGGNPAGTGSLQGVRAAAVQQIRADSQVQPLDVLAPSTYCPLPGHVQPDNRPRDTAREITEKPAYANENPSFSFPIRAWAYGHEGRATVRVQVMADGTPGQMWLKQSSGSGILDVDAREQLAKYRFKPARKNGQPVTAWIDVPVDYRLNAEK